MRDRASSRRPCRSSARIPAAEAFCPGKSVSPSWAAPRRGTVSTSGGALRARTALQYSTPRMLLGCSSSAAVSGSVRRPTARWRAAAKLSPRPSSSFKTGGNASDSRAAATRHNAAASPHSLPKASVSTRPVPSSVSTPPRANRSAGDAAQGRGSSSTRSAPLRTAAAARARRRTRAKSPRWTKSPLMAQTTAASSPSRRRTSPSRWTWPICRGLYSAMIPATRRKITSK